MPLKERVNTYYYLLLPMCYAPFIGARRFRVLVGIGSLGVLNSKEARL